MSVFCPSYLLPDSRMTASSIYRDRKPYYSRFGETRGVGHWCPRALKNKINYLQVDMESASSFCAVATRGTYSSYYSTSYKLRFFYRRGLTEFYKVDNNAKVSGEKLDASYESKFCAASLIFVAR